MSGLEAHRRELERAVTTSCGERPPPPLVLSEAQVAVLMFDVPRETSWLGMNQAWELCEAQRVQHRTASAGRRDHAFTALGSGVARVEVQR